MEQGGNSTQKKVFISDQKEKKVLRLYLFDIKFLLFEIVIAYIIFILCLLIQHKLSFPIFQCLAIFPLGYTLKLNTKIKYACLTVIGLPIIIGNFYLSSRVLTYPSLFIVYLAMYINSSSSRASIFWVLNVILIISTGIVLLPNFYHHLAK